MRIGIHLKARTQLLTTNVSALLLLLFVCSFASAAPTPEKSPNDNNEYRLMELSNGLRTILVSDKDADKAKFTYGRENVPIQELIENEVWHYNSVEQK